MRLLAFALLCQALKLLETIPDQLVMQGSYFQLDVAQFYSEPLSECVVISPEFLTFASDKLEKKELYTLPYDMPGKWAFAAAAENGEDLWVLMSEQGVILFDLDMPPSSRLLQHYFEEQICGRYASLSVNTHTAVLYNSSDILLLDISSKQFPVFITEGYVGKRVLAAFPQGDSQLVVLTRETGLVLYDFDSEAGLSLNRSLNPAFALADDASILTAMQTHEKLFVLSSDGTLKSVLQRDFSDLHSYAVRGSHLLVANHSLLIDTHIELSLTSDTLHDVSLPLPSDVELLACARGLLFYRNETHWSALDPHMQLQYTEELGDLLSLQVVNLSSILILRTQSAVLASFSASKTTIHGIVPEINSAIEVRFTVKGRTTILEGKFLLLVESPPLQILLLMLMGCGVVIGTLCVGYLVYYVVIRGRRKAIEEINILTEESTSGMQMNRDLGPMPHLEL